jgi:predicted O-methyltransferase YrrM
MNRLARTTPAGHESLTVDQRLDLLVATARRPRTYRQLIDVFDRIVADPYLLKTRERLTNALRRNDDCWDLCCVLAAAAELFQPRTYLEIGVRQGRSAAIVAAICPAATLYLLDMWCPQYAGVENPGPEFVREQLRRVGHHGPVHILSGRSQETLPALMSRADPPGPFELMTVDGDHRDAGARADLQNVVAHLAPGGVLVFDDIAHADYPTLYDTWTRFLAACPELTARENRSVATGTAVAMRSLERLSHRAAGP